LVLILATWRIRRAFAKARGPDQNTVPIVTALLAIMTRALDSERAVTKQEFIRQREIEAFLTGDKNSSENSEKRIVN